MQEGSNKTPGVNIHCQKKRSPHPSALMSPKSMASSPEPLLGQLRAPRERPHFSLLPSKRLLHPIFHGWFCTQGCHRSLLGHLLRSLPSFQPTAAKDFCTPPPAPQAPHPDRLLREGCVCSPEHEAVTRDAQLGGTAHEAIPGPDLPRPGYMHCKRSQSYLRAEAWVTLIRKGLNVMTEDCPLSPAPSKPQCFSNLVTNTGSLASVTFRQNTLKATKDPHLPAGKCRD